jgi:putative Se/S carrier protein
MSDGAFSVILVHSTSHAMRITRLMKKKRLMWKLTPVPRHLSSDCGVCVRIRREDTGAARALVEEIGLEIVGIEAI